MALRCSSCPQFTGIARLALARAGADLSSPAIEGDVP
jgi:hypothetical protein